MRQMTFAPRGAFYIWPSNILDYAVGLARSLGRPDLRIVGPSWLDDREWESEGHFGIVMDRACNLTDAQVDSLRDAVGI